MALFLNFKEFYKVFHKNLLAIGSTPVEGSSQNYIFGPPISAIETHSFLLFPPLNLLDCTLV